MADNGFFSKAKALFRETRGNIIVEVVKWLGGSSVMTSLFRIILESYHHNRIDWVFFGFVFGFGILLLGVAVVLKKPPMTVTSEREMSDPGQNVEGFFVPIQIEAFHIAKELTALNRQAKGKTPAAFVVNNFLLPDPSHNENLHQVISSYAVDFAPKVKSIVLRFSKEAKVREPMLEPYFDSIPDASHIPIIQESLVRMALRIDGIYLPANQKSPADPCVGLFTPIQIEAFSLAKRLRKFLHEFGPAPTSGIDTSKAMSSDQTVKQMLFSVDALTSWRTRLCAKYRADFRSDVDKVYNNFVAAGLDSEPLLSKIYAVASEGDIQMIVVELWKLACLSEDKE